jgi:hypothetical protein
MWALRKAAPKHSPWRAAQFGTLRLRLIKIAAGVVELKSRIKVYLPTACPDQQNPSRRPQPDPTLRNMIGEACASVSQTPPVDPLFMSSSRCEQ